MTIYYNNSPVVESIRYYRGDLSGCHVKKETLDRIRLIAISPEEELVRVFMDGTYYTFIGTQLNSGFLKRLGITTNVKANQPASSLDSRLQLQA